MKLFKRVPFLDELLIKSRVLIKPYFVGKKVKIELNNTYLLELTYEEALEAKEQLSNAIHKLEAKELHNNNDIDSLPLDGLTEVNEPSRESISLTLQRTNSRVTRHFEGNYQRLYAHAMGSPNVVLYEIGINQ